jgi:hypothetical protein
MGRPFKTRIDANKIRKEKIRADWIIRRLQAHIAGKIELTVSQVKAADVLLRKIVPDVMTTRIEGELKHTYVVEVPAMMSREEWVERYSPKQIEGPVINGHGEP